MTDNSNALTPPAAMSNLLNQIPASTSSAALQIQSLTQDSLKPGICQDIIIVCDDYGHTTRLINAFSGVKGLFGNRMPLTARETMTAINARVATSEHVTIRLMTLSEDTAGPQDFIEALYDVSLHSNAKHLHLVSLSYLEQLDVAQKEMLLAMP